MLVNLVINCFYCGPELQMRVTIGKEGAASRACSVRLYLCSGDSMCGRKFWMLHRQGGMNVLSILGDRNIIAA